MRDPPDPPRTMCTDSSGFMMMLAAVDERGLPGISTAP